MFDIVDRDRCENLMTFFDVINSKIGRDAVRHAVLGFDRKWKMKQERQSPCYMTRMTELLEVKL